MNKRNIILTTAILFLSLLLSSCLVPDNSYLMELNRNGKWQKAEKVGQDMLKNRRTFTHSEICETYYHVAYAKTRQDKTQEAIGLMEEFDGLYQKEPLDPELAWLERETVKLKDELGILSESQRTLYRAMEENGKGNYSQARELCDTVLAMEGTPPEQIAAAYFVASVCSVRLEEKDRADYYLAGYRKHKAYLPPGHQILGEEAFLLEGIDKL